ncbi:MAG: hypothetical protein HQM14_07925 [SAR324 cluster bacterium]|nr:hypothetical protein [SAR324 cluster bacterium]
MKIKDCKKLHELRDLVECSKAHRCIDSTSQDRCKAKYYAFSDRMECLEEDPTVCEFSERFSGRSSFICTCPLRKYITIHFEKAIDPE